MPQGTILILDDEPEVGQTIGLIAATVGLTPMITDNATVFFSQLERHDPAYIALDLVMPDMDGVEVMRQLAVRHCAARIILISGMGGRVLSAAERSAHEHGLDIIGVIAKPFSARDFRQIMDNATNRVTHRHLEVDGGAPAITERELRRALDQHEFHLVYQPKVICATNELAGFEALVRWHHPYDGIVMPDRFIPLMETLGLMDALTRQVLEQGLSWFARHFIRTAAEFHWHPQLSLSVNISARNLRDIHFADTIDVLCREAGVPPSRLMLELTETSAMEDPTLSLDLLTRLRVKGFQLSLDDFGIGYSSMAQLVRLPFSEIKVDKSFVMSAMSSPESRTAVRTIVDLGHSLGLRATAEGVEDPGTLAFLRDIGCDLSQGFHIARPMPGDQALAWTRTNGHKTPQTGR